MATNGLKNSINKLKGYINELQKIVGSGVNSNNALSISSSGQISPLTNNSSQPSHLAVGPRQSNLFEPKPKMPRRDEEDDKEWGARVAANWTPLSQDGGKRRTRKRSHKKKGTRRHRS